MVNFGYTLMCEQAGPTALVRDARRAEQSGYDFEVISDHYNPWLDAQGHAPNAWSVLGAVLSTHVSDLVASGLAVTTIPGLALRAHRVKGIVARELRGSHRHIYAATYGDPPDPPATTALLAALADAAAP